MSDTIPTQFTVPIEEFMRVAAQRDALREQLAMVEGQREAYRADVEREVSAHCVTIKTLLTKNARLVEARREMHDLHYECEAKEERLADLTISHDLHAENGERLEARLAEAEARCEAIRISRDHHELMATRAERRLAALEAAVRWALGEGDSDFGDHIPEGKGRYWWRSELRRRALLGIGLSASPPPDADRGKEQAYQHRLIPHGRLSERTEPFRDDCRTVEPRQLDECEDGRDGYHD